MNKKIVTIYYDNDWDIEGDLAQSGLHPSNCRLLCGFAVNMGQLIAFRAIQGMGAGGLIVMALTIIGCQRNAVDHHLEAVVFGWIVTGGYHDTAVGIR